MKVVVGILLLATGALAAELSLKLLDDASEKGAVCLDGSASGYYLRKGSTDPDKWIVHMEGGGYCSDEDDCVKRSKTDLGSSKKWSRSISIDGFLSDNCDENPHFCGWTVVFIPYCDGAFYAGNVIEPVKVGEHTIYFRGLRILDAIIEALLATGLTNAEHLVLTGCSAGGIGTYYHVDRVRSMVPKSIPLHALADAGYFLDAPNTQGKYVVRSEGQYVAKMQNVSGGVNQDCVAAMSADEVWKCGFVQYFYQYIKTPIFTYNSAYDTWQLANTLQLGCLPPHCSDEQMKELENYGQEFFKEVSPAIQSATNGVFIDSCLVHCQSLNSKTWTQYKIGNHTIGDTFYSWMTQTSSSHKVVDCAFPCNPTCPVTMDTRGL